MTGEQLRAWREQTRLTQQQLATMLGVSVATVCRWERQRLKTPTIDLPNWLSYAVIGIDSITKNTPR